MGSSRARWFEPSIEMVTQSGSTPGPPQKFPAQAGPKGSFDSGLLAWAARHTKSHCDRRGETRTFLPVVVTGARLPPPGFVFSQLAAIAWRATEDRAVGRR
jgi:hypothetical protein